MILFVLGPSGVGKTSFGHYLARLGWLHIEIDRYPDGDGIDLNDLREEWDAYFLHQNPEPLVRELRRRSHGMAGCVLTFPSPVVPSPAHLRASPDIRAVILFGPANICMESFFAREQQTGRGLSRDHWLLHNSNVHARMGNPEFEPFRIEAFTNSGTRRSHEAILKEILAGPSTRQFVPATPRL